MSTNREWRRRSALAAPGDAISGTAHCFRGWLAAGVWSLLSKYSTLGRENGNVGQLTAVHGPHPRATMAFAGALRGAAAAGAAFLTLSISLKLDHPSQIWWAYGGDARDLRGLLSSLLSGMMTIHLAHSSLDDFRRTQPGGEPARPKANPQFYRRPWDSSSLWGFSSAPRSTVLITLRSLDGSGGAVPQLAVIVSGAL